MGCALRRFDEATADSRVDGGGQHGRWQASQDGSHLAQALAPYTAVETPGEMRLDGGGPLGAEPPVFQGEQFRLDVPPDAHVDSSRRS